ncbi:MAG: hypothetical protein ACO3N9_13205 [Alphaproteobacteria bacterium]
MGIPTFDTAKNRDVLNISVSPEDFLRSMTVWYRKTSIKEGNSRELREVIDAGHNDPLRLRSAVKFQEAEDLRGFFKSLTAARLAEMKSVRDLNIYPEIAVFRAPTHGQILWLRLMLNFYEDKPTERGDILAEMGSSYRAGEMLVRQGLAAGAVASEADPDDRRRSLLFPSLITVFNYEFVLIPKMLEAASTSTQLEIYEKTLAQIHDYYALGRKYYSEKLDIEIAARQARIDVSF